MGREHSPATWSARMMRRPAHHSDVRRIVVENHRTSGIGLLKRPSTVNRSHEKGAYWSMFICIRWSNNQCGNICFISPPRWWNCSSRQSRWKLGIGGLESTAKYGAHWELGIQPCWLVVWNMNLIFPYIGNNAQADLPHPNQKYHMNHMLMIC